MDGWRSNTHRHTHANRRISVTQTASAAKPDLLCGKSCFISHQSCNGDASLSHGTWSLIFCWVGGWVVGSSILLLLIILHEQYLIFLCEESGQLLEIAWREANDLTAYFKMYFFGNGIHRFWFSIKSMKTYLLFQPLLAHQSFWTVEGSSVTWPRAYIFVKTIRGFTLF